MAITGLDSSVLLGFYQAQLNGSASAISAGVTNGYFSISFPVLKSATDVALTPEWSEDLVTWQSGPAFFQQVNQLDAGATQLITLQATAPVSQSGRGFFRLRASRL